MPIYYAPIKAQFQALTVVDGMGSLGWNFIGPGNGNQVKHNICSSYGYITDCTICGTDEFGDCLTCLANNTQDYDYPDSFTTTITNSSVLVGDFVDLTIYGYNLNPQQQTLTDEFNCSYTQFATTCKSVGFAIDRYSNLWGWGGAPTNDVPLTRNWVTPDIIAVSANTINPVSNINWLGLLPRYINFGNTYVGACIYNDGSLRMWGDNTNYQVGIGSSTYTSGTTAVLLSGTKNWNQISAGSVNTIAVRKDGTLWSWGQGGVAYVGVDGRNGAGGSAEPAQIGSDTNWKQVNVGNYNAAAVKNDKTLWTWGYIFWGAIGNGSYGVNSGYSSPIQIGTTEWEKVSISSNYVLAIKTDGTLWAWGNNSTGQLGLGNTADKSVPTQVGTDTDWFHVEASNTHAVALKTNGTLYTWGDNIVGQLGIGDTVNRSIPTAVGSLSNWMFIASKGSHTLAIKTDGTLWSWGRNDQGQLGLGSFTNKSSPVQVGTDTDWELITATYGVSLATKKNSNRLWGAGGYLQLLPFSNQTTFASFHTNYIGTGYKKIAASSANVSPHVLSVKTDGTLWALGTNNSGQLGTGNTTVQSSFVQIGSLTDWKDVAVHKEMSLAIKTNNTLWAWGNNTNGNLGTSNTTSYSSPVQIGALSNWAFVTANRYTCLAVKTDGTLWGWGNNLNGQIGNGTTTSYSSPVQIGSLTTWSIVQAYDLNDDNNITVLAIKTDGTLWGWGRYISNSGGGTSSPVQIGTNTDWANLPIGGGLAGFYEYNGAKDYSNYYGYAAITSSGDIYNINPITGSYGTVGRSPILVGSSLGTTVKKCVASKGNALILKTVNGQNRSFM